MRYGELVMSIVTGTAIGATLGILFAPNKGSATREKITRQSNEYSDAAVKKFNKVIDGSHEPQKTVRQRADAFAE